MPTENDLTILNEQIQKLIINGVEVSGQLKGIQSTLDLELRNVRATVDRNHTETTKDIDHLDRSLKAQGAALTKLLEEKVDAKELEANQRESDQRYDGYKTTLASLATKEELAVVRDAADASNKNWRWVTLLICGAVVAAILGTVLVKTAWNDNRSVNPPAVVAAPLPKIG